MAFDAALAKRLPALTDIKFRGGILMWEPEIFKIEDPAGHMTWNSWHMGGIERKAAAKGVIHKNAANRKKARLAKRLAKTAG